GGGGTEAARPGPGPLEPVDDRDADAGVAVHPGEDAGALLEVDGAVDEPGRVDLAGGDEVEDLAVAGGGQPPGADDPELPHGHELQGDPRVGVGADEGPTWTWRPCLRSERIAWSTTAGEPTASMVRSAPPPARSRT